VAGSFFNKLLLFLLLPIFTHYLLPEEYAVYTNLMIFFSLMSHIVVLGMQHSLFSHFYQQDSEQYRYKLISSVYIFLLITGILFAALIILFRQHLAVITARDAAYSHLFYNIALIIFFNTVFTISTGFLNIAEKSGSYAVISSLQNLLLLVLILIFVLRNFFSLQLYFDLFTISTIVAASISFFSILTMVRKYDLNKDERVRFSLPILSSMLKFGLVMVPGSISLLILQASDRFMLTYLSVNKMHDAGIYSAGYRIGMIMHFLISIISLVYYPYAVKIAGQEKARTINRQVFNYFILFGLILGSAIILFAQEFFRVLIDQRFFISHQVVFSGVISAFLYGIFNIININFYIHKRAKNITLAVAIGSLLNIVLNFLLIPNYGIFGAAVASIIAYFVLLCINFLASRVLFKTKYNFSYIVLSALILSSLAVLNLFMQLSLTIFLIKFAAFVVISIVIFLYFKKNEQFIALYRSLKRGRNEI
jgi:O-antigen/teichoic acid export membrane protein